MRFVFFCHSLCSDWNNGNAHFLRGVVSELLERNHEVRVYEPHDGWSHRNLVELYGVSPLEEFRLRYPRLQSTMYDLAEFDLDAALHDADVVVVHEWNSPELVARVGDYRRREPHFLLFFHDTHHRSVTAPQEMRAYDLSTYDAVLAFGRVICDVYRQRGWAEHAYVWHEAADHRVFFPHVQDQLEGDVVWIGNWGDAERSEELHEFLIDPVRRLGLRARVYGVRYPDEARTDLATAGIEFGGWLPNFRVPEVLARFRMTLHVPRRPYARRLPGIPTIRVFEALACGAPLISAPWRDTENLFTPEYDFLLARDGEEMQIRIRSLLGDPAGAAAMAEHGRQTILQRHTCAHRVRQLLDICAEFGKASGALDREPAGAASGGSAT